MKNGPRIIIIAGPNGAGKTTFANEFLPKEADCPVFVNFDLIAAGLSPFDPDAASIKAGRLMIKEIDAHVRKEESFAFETTLSGRTYIRKVALWQKKGYHIKLIFLSLPDVKIALRRVRERVKHGGHNVPDDVIQRRHSTGWRNFQNLYKHIADSWLLYDNSGANLRLIDSGENHRKT